MKDSVRRTLQSLHVNGNLKMKIDNYTTLKALSESSGVNYHTLRVWLIKSKASKKKVGAQIFIRCNEVRKILAIGGR
jgi:hypothetical protein